MNTKKYNWILYLITATIVTTIAVQFYWNYKNYQENRKRVTNEIQISLDNAVEEYYSNISKRNFFASFDTDSINKISLFNDMWLEGQSVKGDSTKFSFNSMSFKGRQKGLTIVPDIIDSLLQRDSIVLRGDSIRYENHYANSRDISQVRVVERNTSSDSLRVLKGLKTVYSALKNNTIDFPELDSLFNNQLASKDISTDYYFDYLDYNSIIGSTKDDSSGNLTLSTNSKSTYLRPWQQLKLYYSNPAILALKKSSTGILLSLLLSLTVISSLFYLLKIIQKQKELAEIKNDLISNITHEFKTPIATVSTAIEAIESFNVIDDKEKTQKYLAMSGVQLKKLHQMVEKLLETATLDSENLILKKEDIDLVDLVNRATTKHQMLTDKKIIFSSNIASKGLKIDLFHFENAISNLVDNAIKYGGETIEVNINSVLNHIEISIADDGKGIEKNQQEKIFDKFYRIPKGNRHDVKGFGIGLYYSKKIVEKHNGSIQLISNNQNTIFKINLPDE
jgi:two-component system phosphate regulon sensor histidine kinase PhoR